jgi:hypothetical protein
MAKIRVNNTPTPHVPILFRGLGPDRNSQKLTLCIFAVNEKVIDSDLPMNTCKNIKVPNMKSKNIERLLTYYYLDLIA